LSSTLHRSFPPGLQIRDSEIRGTPTQAGAFQFELNIAVFGRPRRYLYQMHVRDRGSNSTEQTARTVPSVSEYSAAAALFAKDQAKARLCSIGDIPIGRGTTLTEDQRVRLYLNCELTGNNPPIGGAKACCDHLSAADATKYRVCPDSPVNLIVPLRDGFKATLGACR
jgi:hypothetical protein